MIVDFSMFRLIAEVSRPTRELRQGLLASNLLPVLFIAVIQGKWDFKVGPVGGESKKDSAGGVGAGGAYPCIVNLVTSGIARALAGMR